MGQSGCAIDDLPNEVLLEIGVRSPLNNVCHAMRIDIQVVACMRIQRRYRYRYWQGPRVGQLRVGDCVLARIGGRRRCIYATAAAWLRQSGMWKLRLLDGTDNVVPASRLHRLQDWADGPCAEHVGRSTAIASALAARSAATHANETAMAALRSGVSSTQTALAIAAATTAATAAVAATAAARTTVEEATVPEPCLALVTDDLVHADLLASQGFAINARH